MTFTLDGIISLVPSWYHFNTVQCHLFSDFMLTLKLNGVALTGMFSETLEINRNGKGGHCSKFIEHVTVP